MFHTSDHRLARALHVALGLLMALEGGFILARCIVGERDLQLIAFSAVQTTGAMLFIWSRTIATGACMLVCAFVIAAVFHVLGHTLPFEHLIYAVAVLVVLVRERARVVGAGPAA